jgi:hypothetical protein
MGSSAIAWEDTGRTLRSKGFGRFDRFDKPGYAGSREGGAEMNLENPIVYSFQAPAFRSNEFPTRD